MYSTEELRVRAELTDRIVANLKIIDDHEIVGDLDQMEKQIGNIVRGLETLDGDSHDLDELEKQVGNIVCGLRIIEQDETDLDELEKQVTDIATT